jgi:hypothetical protein
MSVRDHGLEAIRKSAGEVVPGAKDEYFLLTKILGAITGSFSPSGLFTDWLITTMDISDTATPLPATPLSGRNSIIVFNKSLTETLYIGKSDLTADTVNGTTSGWDIPKNSYYAFDVRDSIVIYGRCETGKSVKVKIMELA